MIAGRDGTWPPVNIKGKLRQVHTVFNVWSHMSVQLMLDANLSPVDIERMKMSDVAFWYDRLRPLLKRRTKPKPKKS